jgi:hypothetical protein
MPPGAELAFGVDIVEHRWELHVERLLPGAGNHQLRDEPTDAGASA